MPPACEGRLSAAVIPLLAAAVVVYALYKKVNVYDAFVNGAKESLPLIARILPYMAAMLIVIELLNTGGMMSMITNLLSGPLSRLGLPAELLPMALLRPFSGSAAMAFVSDIFDKNGVDSVLGMAASTMMGSSETIFYTLALYFGCVGIQKTRFTLPVALIASLVSVIASIWICNLMFG